ncbi:hypothetical protein MSAN_00712500 [Mycena sanguinolenta]|uniref:RhoGAP-domain-containing protein n=1 Tax=Mycena sanguinolenta TaxID=230812 RepID=A0A8H6Z7S4_9AGAR|nr:hypothetical protein MSAN_00712500 [Mycena sanguinolenta]
MTSTPSRSNHAFPQPSTSSPAFSQSSHLHQRTPTSSSASSANLPANVPSPAAPAAAMTLDALLSTHAAAQDPKLAALDQAVSERNVLSSQNTQLWKLIEKQRTGYNQILKELERVRGERDGYKTKLAALAGGSPDRRRKESAPNGTLNGTADYVDSPRLPRTPATAMDDIRACFIFPRLLCPNARKETPRRDYRQPETPLERQHESQPQTRQQETHPQPFATAPSFQSNSTSTPPRQKSNLAPLLVPPRAESLPLPSSAVSATSETAPFSHGSRLVPRSDSTPVTAQSHTSSTHRSSPLAAAPQTAVYSPQPIVQTPHTVGESSGHGHAHHASTATITQRDPQPQITTTAPENSTDSPSPSSIQGPSAAALLSDVRSQALSRESRISLPDEARQYIANMGDTPVPSPKVDAFAPRALPQAPAEPPSSSHSQFLDLEEDEADDEDNDERGDEEDDSGAEVPESSIPVTQPLYAPRRQPPTAASDFPLPPPTLGGQPPDAQAQAANTQAQALAYQQAQAAAAMAQQQQQQQRAREQIQQQQQQYQQQQQWQQEQQFQRPSVDTLVDSATPLQPNRAQQQQQFAQSSETLVNPQQQPTLNPQVPLQPQRLSPVATTVPASFRALPLLSSDLPTTTVVVSHSFVRPNDRGKEVLSFVVYVDPGNNKEGWKVEKMYSDVLALDQRVRNSVGKTVGKKMANLPEGKLWKDHAPAKVDQRKAILETYLQALVNLPVKNNDEVIAFFTSDIVREYKQPVMQAGHKEGYLTKRGKNFGGWKTRFFVLQGPVLEYYDCRGGAHLGSITVTGAQIGRQQRTERPTTDEEKEYRHAFLIVEAKKGPGGNHPRHVLCAESDADRDAWVEILVRYFSGTYSEDPVSYGAPPPAYTNGAARPSTDAYNRGRSTSPTRSVDYSSPIERPPGAGGFNDSQAARRVMEQHKPSSLPDSSPLTAASQELQQPSQRANSEQGYYPDMQLNRRTNSPEQHRTREKGFQPTLNTVVSSPITPAAPVERPPSPESKPRAAAVVPPANAERREKAKSRGFWGGFGRSGAGNSEKTDKAHAYTPPAVTFVPRAVFGVTLEESLDVAQIANLPAIVFRCIQYLEAKKADQEEGIYRLSGSSAVIKNLKDRFNMEGDIDLVGSDEYWDPHAIAGLLKSFLRELPASILTHNLHLRFLAVIDFVDAQERIKELSQLISALPIANYSLLRALTAHLILIVQNAAVNKMTMRNVGIVFSPTLGIPAGVFSLMLAEFNRVFNVDDKGDDAEEASPQDEGGGATPASPAGGSDRSPEATHRRRNSQQYSSGAADQLLGLSGRTLTSAEEGPSDDDSSIQYESETTEDNATAESSSSSSPQPPPETPREAQAQTPRTSKAATTATTKGLNLSIRGNRHSTMMGLPMSPRPPGSPRPVDAGA